jgi:hypothetical protein
MAYDVNIEWHHPVTTVERVAKQILPVEGFEGFWAFIGQGEELYRIWGVFEEGSEALARAAITGSIINPIRAGVDKERGPAAPKFPGPHPFTVEPHRG